MKTLLAVIVATLAFTQAEAAKLKINDPMPTITGAAAQMKGVHGKFADKTFTLDAVKGKKGTLVVFTCNHCPYAKAWEARLTEWANMGLDKGIGAIFINSNDYSKNPEDSPEKMKEQATRLKKKFPYVIDSTSGVAKAFGARKTPEAFLFDASGKLVYMGAPDASYEKTPEDSSKLWLKNAIMNLAAGKPIEKADSKAIGCSIKWRSNS